MDITEALPDLLRTIEGLRKTYETTKKNFTIDGRLLGDIGEVLVAASYDVTLYPGQPPQHDGYDSQGRKIQIKATMQDSLTFPCRQDKVPDYYIGIQILPDGSFAEIFNGPGLLIANALRKRNPTPNGLHGVSRSLLSRLNKNVNAGDRIHRKGQE